MFDLLLMGSQDRLIERATARYEGETLALEKLRDPDQVTQKLVVDFVDAVFCDFGIESVGGACFVLQGLQLHRSRVQAFEGSVGEFMIQLAKRLFGELLLKKTIEAFELLVSYDFRGSAI